MSRTCTQLLPWLQQGSSWCLPASSCLSDQKRSSSPVARKATQAQESKRWPSDKKIAEERSLTKWKFFFSLLWDHLCRLPRLERSQAMPSNELSSRLRHPSSRIRLQILQRQVCNLDGGSELKSHERDCDLTWGKGRLQFFLIIVLRKQSWTRQSSRKVGMGRKIHWTWWML